MFNFKFNMDHCIKVLNARDKHGFPRRNTEDREIKDHPLLGKKCICLDSDKEYYIVKSAWKNWHLGYYITLILHDKNNSGRVIEYENINCHEKIILDSIDDNKKIVQFIP